MGDSLKIGQIDVPHLFLTIFIIFFNLAVYKLIKTVIQINLFMLSPYKISTFKINFYNIEIRM